MPENLKDLYRQIWEEAEEAGLSLAQRHYAVGWIFFDLFERVTHEQKRTGSHPTAEIIDRCAAEIPDGKISRSLDEAQEEFGKAAANFMEDEIQRRNDEAVAKSVVIEVRSIRSDIKGAVGGMKAFGVNVSAGVVSGLVFAIILMVAATIWTLDPSPIQLEKNIIHGLNQHPSPGTPQPPTSGKEQSSH